MKEIEDVLYVGTDKEEQLKQLSNKYIINNYVIK